MYIRGLGGLAVSLAAGYAALLVALTPSAFANVIGIDLGVDFMKVALVARGKPLEIVTNAASKRKTEMAVNFDRGERNFGSDAYALVSRKPKQTYTKMTTMLGRDLEHPSLAPILSRLPNDVGFKADEGGVVLSLNDNGAEAEYSAVELVAMILSSAQEMTGMFGYSVNDAVITVPEFATAHERRALLDAADVAGLTVLSLMDENTAAALQHAISQTYEEDTNVMFYNMGANSIKVTIVTFGPKKIKDRNVGKLIVRGKGWDASVGGWWFDLKLADVFAEGFNAKWGKGDVREFPRPMGKMITQATKVKKVLSANAEIPVNLNSLHDDVDYSSTVTRTSFEAASKDLFERVTGPIDRALEQAGMKLSDIQEVEIIGGGSRIPKVRETLSRYLSIGVDQPLALGAHLNGDESPCLGAAFRGANQSRAFDVRKVGMTDITPWAVDLSFADLDESKGFKGVLGGLFGGGKKDGKDAAPTLKTAGEVFKEVPLYGENTPLPLKKTLSITRSENFEVNVTYATPADGGNTQLPEGTQEMIASYQVTGVADFAKKMEEEGRGAPKVALRFTSGIAGVPELASAEAFVEFEKNVTYTEDVVVDDEEDTETEKEGGDGETAVPVTEQEDASKNEGDADADSGADVAATDSADTEVEGAAAADPATGTEENKDKSEGEGDGGDAKDGKDKKEKPKKKKKKTIKVDKTKIVTDRKKAKLDVVPHFTYMRIHPLTDEGTAASKAKLSALRAADEVRRETAQAKNDLESYILKVRAALRDFDANLEVVSTEQQREEAIVLATEQEDWLYDDGWDMDAATYRKKRGELAELAEAMFLRSSELVARPAELARGREFTAKVRESVEKWEKTKPHITEQERTDVMEKIDSAEKWMSDKEAEQAAHPPHETPVFKSAEVEPALKALKNLVTKLSKKPAPKKEKPAKADNSTEEAATNGDEGEESPEGEGEGKAEEGEEGVVGEGEEEGAEGAAAADAEADPSREEL
ncbi:HSP70 [Ectocarpus sp. CCAP 1310/34]|nr:HSP70 [Ectocarpus sp. CCAP 1310/34]